MIENYQHQFFFAGWNFQIKKNILYFFFVLQPLDEFLKSWNVCTNRFTFTFFGIIKMSSELQQS